MERLIRATPDDVIIQNDIEDRPPIREWGRGRVTLLGDAAHPTTPNLGQGASLALEDGTVLRWCLRVAADPIAALRAYEERRWRRTAAVTRMSWSLGRVAQLENGLARRLRDELVRLTPEWLSRRQYSRLTAFDIEGLPTSRSHLEDAH